MDTVLTIIDGDIKFEVVNDDNAYEDCFRKDGWDFENEEEKEAYRMKWVEGDIFGFGVVEFEKCNCSCPNCNGWTEKDSIYGFHAESAESALKEYRN